MKAFLICFQLTRGPHAGSWYAQGIVAAPDRQDRAALSRDREHAIASVKRQLAALSEEVGHYGIWPGPDNCELVAFDTDDIGG